MKKRKFKINPEKVKSIRHTEVCGSCGQQSFLGIDPDLPELCPKCIFQITKEYLKFEGVEASDETVDYFVRACKRIEQHLRMMRGEIGSEDYYASWDFVPCDGRGKEGRSTPI